jgi:hypothetical protein
MLNALEKPTLRRASRAAARSNAISASIRDAIYKSVKLDPKSIEALEVDIPKIIKVLDGARRPGEDYSTHYNDISQQVGEELRRYLEKGNPIPVATLRQLAATVSLEHDLVTRFEHLAYVSARRLTVESLPTDFRSVPLTANDLADMRMNLSEAARIDPRGLNAGLLEAHAGTWDKQKFVDLANKLGACTPALVKAHTESQLQSRRAFEGRMERLYKMEPPSDLWSFRSAVAKSPLKME